MYNVSKIVFHSGFIQVYMYMGGGEGGGDQVVKAHCTHCTYVRAKGDFNLYPLPPPPPPHVHVQYMYTCIKKH